MLQVVETGLEPDDEYEILDAALTELLERAGVDVDEEEIIGLLLAYNRQLRIALGLPVEVPS
ncbi:hypothetical protein K3174_09860 [Qipengyuania sp. 6D47A]|uniref:Transcriptional regulator n=1 Tax=Qipengyuania qiaonensis TaxID=2867240 RepID=A0ABS7J689_9SPHN|nr:hypothetical protein [Qipengyuania qiaonensis]